MTTHVLHHWDPEGEGEMSSRILRQTCDRTIRRHIDDFANIHSDDQVRCPACGLGFGTDYLARITHTCAHCDDCRQILAERKDPSHV